MMNRRIESVRTANLKLTPTSAEVLIAVRLASELHNPEFRGRLMGPRCRYASTVEVAFPIQPLERLTDRVWACRVVIPEPNWWDLTSPFLYQGPIELWQDGRLIEQVDISHGSRVLDIGPKGLTLNGKPIPLRGICRSFWFEEELLQLRREGFSCVLAPAESMGLCESADRVGMFVMARFASSDAMKSFDCGGHNPSMVGFLVAQDLLDRPEWPDHDAFLRILASTPLLEKRRTELARLLGARDMSSWRTGACCNGIELHRLPSKPLPEWAAFVACSEELLPRLDAIALPKLLLRKAGSPEREPIVQAGILGHIDEPATSPDTGR